MGRWAWHVHHETLLGRLEKGGLGERRRYIKKYKPKGEIPLRLILLRAVGGKLPAVLRLESMLQDFDNIGRGKEAQAAQKQIRVLHEKECPGCPWDGESIFNRPRKAARLLAGKA